MDVARFVRIFEPDPSDDFVTKRTAAIRQLKAHFLKQRNVGKLMSLATETFGVFQNPPVVAESYAEVIEGAIKKQSESFVRDGRDLEMSVCAMIAVVHAIQGSGKASEGWAVGDVLATAVWSGASFLPANPEPKLEEFRSQTVDAAKQRILESSLDTRVRRNVPEFGAFGDEQLGAEAFGEATGATIDALQYNAALDREELDMLWWVLGDTSNVLEKPLASLSPETRAIVSGIELGALLRALPSQSHRNLCARGVGETESMTLPAVLEALGDDRTALAANFANEILVDEATSVFPLLNGIRAGSSALAGSDVARPLKEWCARALLERAVLRVQYPGNRRR